MVAVWPDAGAASQIWLTWEEQYGFSRGVRVGNRIEIAGAAPIPPPEESVAATAYAQMLRCGEIAIAALYELGASPADVVRPRMYITDPLR